MQIVNVLSIDVEDYYQVSAFEKVVARADWDRFESRVVRNTERLLKILEEAHTRATFFVLGWIAERAPALVRAIAKAGHEVQSHGYSHRMVRDLFPEEFREELRRARAIVENETGTRVAGFRAPSYSITNGSMWALDVLIEEGFVFDSSIFPIHHDRYGVPDAPRHAHTITRAAGSIVEVPPSTVRVSGLNLPMSGGGYFRILPYDWTRRGIRRLNEVEGKPAVFYVHPWEIDAAQPRLSGPWRSRFRHYRNLDCTEQRLRRLLSEFRFDTMSNVILSAAAPAAAVSP